jgi:hypothetical protein
MYKETTVKWGIIAFIEEEALPFTDVIPAFTLTWDLYLYY